MPITYFEYDELGNRTAIVDDRGKTEFAYDARNRLIRHTYPTGQEFVFWYDANSRRTCMEDPDDGLTYDEYDALARLMCSTPRQ